MIPLIERQGLKEKIERGEEFHLVEALPESMYRQGHLPGAVNVPPPKVSELAPELLPDKSALIVVYCANPTCTSSEYVARALAAQGYTNVMVYAGGKEEWIAAGLPLEQEGK